MESIAFDAGCSTETETGTFVEPLLAIEDLKVYFPIRRGVFSGTHGWVSAVDGVSLELRKGETIGLVGESGCGKTTTCLAALRLVKPTGGRVTFQGRDVLQMTKNELRTIRRQIQIIFRGSLLISQPQDDGQRNPLRSHGGAWCVRGRSKERTNRIPLGEGRSDLGAGAALPS